ncbi:MAG: Gx transporter family protein [Clostridia bacterium]|nr:Gx transporter family protein [Clostridia bacterium]
MISSRVKRLTLDAMLLGVALMLSYLEAVLPLSLAIALPGAKLGLCNVAIMLCFYAVSPVDALGVSLTRIVLTTLLFGNVSSFTFSLFGGLLAYGGMWLGKLLWGRVSYYGISVLCASLHNIGQCIAGAILLCGISVFSYLPLLLLFSVIFGLITAAVITPIMRLFKNA